MTPYINITGKILLEVRDRRMNEVLWTHEGVIGVDHDKDYFYIYTTEVDSAIKISKKFYMLGIQGGT